RQLDENDRARRAITVVLAQMKLEAAERDLHVERHIRFEAVLPVEREAEKAKIEVPRLLHIEYPEDRDDALNFHAALRPPRQTGGDLQTSSADYSGDRANAEPDRRGGDRRPAPRPRYRHDLRAPGRA